MAGLGLRTRTLLAAGLALFSLAGCDRLPFFPANGTGPTPEAQAPEPETPPAAIPVQPGALEGALSAIGPLGAWRGSFSPERGMVLDDRETGEVLTADYAPPAAEGDGVRLGGASLTALVSSGPCLQGREGVRYPFSVTLTRAGAAPLQGCVYRPWQPRIVALYPAIAACLRAAGEGAMAAYVANEGSDAAFVRIVQPGGALSDCRAPLAGGAAPNITTAAPGAFPGEGDEWFLMGPGDNPGGECYTAPEVRSADGALLGWLVDPEGC